MMMSVGNGSELPRCLDPRSSYDKMKDPWRNYKQRGAQWGYGGFEMERDVVRKRRYAVRYGKTRETQLD